MKTRPMILLALTTCLCVVCDAPKTAMGQDIDPYGGVDELMKKQSTKAKKSPKKNKVRELPINASTLPLMEAICPKHAKLIQHKAGRIPVCTQCPKEAHTQAPELRPTRVVQVEDKYAVVSTLGCGGGFNFDDSTIVLQQTKKSGWKMLSYTSQQNTEDCDWLPVTPPVAICTYTEAGQGSAETSIYSIGLQGGTLKPGPLTSLVDNEMTCNHEGTFIETLDDTVFEDVDADGQQEMVLLISTKTGKKTGKKRPKDTPHGCDDIKLGVIKVEESKVAKFFRLDDGKFKQVEIKKTKVTHEKVRQYIN